MFYLTSEELEQLNQEVDEVLMRWFRFEERLEDPSRRPPDSVPVEAFLLAYPTAPPKPIHDAELPSAADRRGLRLLAN